MSTGSHSFQDIHLQISVDQLRGVERMRTQLELNRIRVKLCAYDIYGSTSFSPQMGVPEDWRNIMQTRNGLHRPTNPRRS